MNSTLAHRVGRLGLLLSGFAAPRLCRAQVLETETARPVGSGVLEFSTNFEYQTSSEGSETAIPLAVEYGINNRFELLVEPVAYTAIRPNSGPEATGIGDLEVTGTYLIAQETAGRPALAFAGEIKIPTARNTLIGTGKTDYTAYAIGSKRFGRLDMHANVGYTVVGRPAGSQLKNIFNFALAAERALGSTTQLFAEVLGNTASSSAPEPTGPVSPGAATPEAPSGEVVGTVGIAKFAWRTVRLSAGISVDNNGAVLLRPGFTVFSR